MACWSRNRARLSAGVLEVTPEIEDRRKLYWWDSLNAASALDYQVTSHLGEDKRF